MAMSDAAPSILAPSTITTSTSAYKCFSKSDTDVDGHGNNNADNTSNYGEVMTTNVNHPLTLLEVNNCCFMSAQLLTVDAASVPLKHRFISLLMSPEPKLENTPFHVRIGVEILMNSLNLRLYQRRSTKTASFAGE